MNRFNIVDLPIGGLKLVKRQALKDNRGFLSRLFCATELANANWCGPVMQINHTGTIKKGTVRGMHFQHAPYTEIKLVTCLRGAIWDVVVDVRANSATFLHWHAEELTEKNNYSLLIPAGFAHGFQTLTDDVEMLYCHSTPYVAEAEAGLNPADTKLQIAWPLPINELSTRDAGHAMLDDRFKGVSV